MPITRRAYAKVNLALAVAPPLPRGNPDAGMHPIASWMHSIGLWDDVELEPLAAGPSRCESAWAPDAPRPIPIDWPPEQDLAVRAHRLMEREAGRELPISLRLVKRIPAGGGLGGGSSDAAAVMIGLNEAFGLGVPSARLVELSRGLGSDVAYFIDGQNPPRPAVVEGLGDQIHRAERVTGRLVLVIPPFGCPTGAVYKAFDAQPPRPWRGERVAALAGEAAPDPGSLFNDLTEAAWAVEPRLRELMERVGRAAAGPVVMSGSGSTMFVVAKDQGSSAVISGKIRASVPDVTVLDVGLV